VSFVAENRLPLEVKVPALFGRFQERLLGEPRTLILMRLALEQVANGGPVDPDLHQVTLQELMARPTYEIGWSSRDEAIRRLRQGHSLFVLRSGQHETCFGWVECGTATNRWMRLRFELSDDVVYFSGLFTIPAYRRKGLAARLWSALARVYKERGAKYVVVAVDPDNEPSLRLHAGLGFAPYQSITYRSWLRIVRYYCVKDARSESRRRFAGLLRDWPTLWKTFW
jgi:ribosomal protein S18 acetylase RimI-like enzyme